MQGTPTPRSSPARARVAPRQPNGYVHAAAGAAVALLLLLSSGAQARAQEAAGPEFFTTELTEGLGLPFSEVARVGEFVFLSGMIGIRPGTMELVPGGMAAEARQTMENIGRMLSAAGAGRDDVVKCTVMLDDMAEWPAFNTIYVDFFGDHRPVRSALGADGLALGAAVEVECIAATPRARSAAAAATHPNRGADERAVLAAAQALLDVINTRDSDAARELLIPEGSLVRVLPEAGGRPAVTTHEEFVRTIGRAGPDLFERMWDAEVRVHGPIATVWAPYDFHVDGEFSHCGINAFSLVRSGAEWKVAGVVYTVERGGCPASPLDARGSADAGDGDPPGAPPRR